ncbi:MAG: carbonic anhydrase [Xanthomonadales bacterium]|nr:carbonic anhydrase [Xanthomonadales bacterium]
MRLDATQALTRLKEGNQRFVQGLLSLDALLSHAQARRDQIAAAQEPFAVILGCSDSRAPAEILFDQGLGDLFVIRVAGNIAAPSQIASVEFAVERFGVELVVVLGHSNCGAIAATLDCMQRREEAPVGLRAVVDRIRPALAPLADLPFGVEPENLMRHAVHANVRATAHLLRSGSQLLEQKVLAGSLAIVGADYDIASGAVQFFDDAPR